MVESCNHKGCSYPVVNKKHHLCQVHNWERTHEGENFYEHQQKKQQGYAKKMREKALEKAKEAPRKMYTWKSNKPRKPINPVSKKMTAVLTIYSQIKKVYVNEHTVCEAHFCNCNTPKDQLTIHHKLGRVGYATDEKRALEIPLLLDPDYFMAVCVSAHRWIEDNVAKAKEWGYSLDRNRVYIK